MVVAASLLVFSLQELVKVHHLVTLNLPLALLRSLLLSPVTSLVHM